jgi:hypothetical protein
MGTLKVFSILGTNISEQCLINLSVWEGRGSGKVGCWRTKKGRKRARPVLSCEENY